MGMIERVARAICRSMESDPDEHWRVYEDEARAAIEAMSAPTPKMCRAACAAMSPGKRPTPNRVSHKAKHAIRYRAMIQAALEEKQ